MSRIGFATSHNYDCKVYIVHRSFRVSFNYSFTIVVKVIFGLHACMFVLEI